MTATACGACGASEREPAFEGRDWLMGFSDAAVTYSRCRRCRTVYADPQPDEATLSAAYGSEYLPHQDRPGLVDRLGDRLAMREAAWLVELAGPGGSLVDAGCGGGALLRRLRATGWTGEMRGVEPAPQAAAATSERLGIPVDVAPVEELPGEPGSLDIVVMRHVIEHVRDPLAVLEHIRTVLKPGGRLYLATPDQRALGRMAFGRYWAGYDPPRHLNVFTRESLGTLFSRAGFTVTAERWDFAPQMWLASLHSYAVAAGLPEGTPRYITMLNPIVSVPAVLAGLAEVALRRSMMYGALARAS